MAGSAMGTGLNAKVFGSSCQSRMAELSRFKVDAAFFVVRAKDNLQFQRPNSVQINCIVLLKKDIHTQSCE
jgi:hypothetical protein